MQITKKQIKYIFICAIAGYLPLLTYIDITKGFSRNNAWTFGDWLINYNSGFIRRGFAGQLAIYLGNPKVLILLIHLISYSLICICLYLILKKQNFPQIYFASIITPAFLMFPLLDPQGGFRKEVLTLSLIALAALSKTSFSPKNRKRLYLITIISFPFLILSHEILSIFLPLIILINLDVIKNDRRYTIYTAIAVFISCAVFLTLLLLPNPSLEDVTLMCAPLNKFCNTDPIKNGALTWLTYTSKHGFSFVKKVHYNWASILRYFSSWLLLIPAIYLMRSSLKKSVSSGLALSLFLAFWVGLLALHFVAVDHGRFIHIAFSSMVFVALSFSDRSGRESISITPFFIVICLLYLPLWRIHHIRTLSLSFIVEALLP